MIGWICPKCNRSVNPNQNHCDCEPLRFNPYVQPYEPFKPIWVTPYPPYTTISSGSTVSDDTNKYTVII